MTIGLNRSQLLNSLIYSRSFWHDEIKKSNNNKIAIPEPLLTKFKELNFNVERYLTDTPSLSDQLVNEISFVAAIVDTIEANNKEIENYLKILAAGQYKNKTEA